MAKNTAGSNGANFGFEEKLWQAADKLRNNMDAAEYKHVVLGLIFLKYISDAFEEMHEKLLSEVEDGADPKTRKSISQKTSSGCLLKPAGTIWKGAQSNPLSGKS